MIYLDNASTTKVDETLKDIFDKYYFEDYFNPSSVYRPSVKIKREIENSRNIIANCLNVNSKTIFFTSCATESNNWAIWGKVSNKNTAEYVFTSVEHPSVFNIAKQLEQQEKIVHFCPINENGTVDENKLLNLINENTVLVSIMHVNNETGAINDIENIVKKIKEKNNNVFIHVDGVQAFLKLNVDLQKLNVDAYSISGHKVHAPKGIGVLYLKNPQKQKQLLFGGGQENNSRSGTENVASIIALGKIVEKESQNISKNYDNVENLKANMVDFFNKNLTDFVINANGSPYILNISIKGIKAEVLLHMLSDMEIYISAGSACSSKKKISRVLENMNVKKEYIEGSLRISFSTTNTLDEINTASKIIVEQIKKLREKMIWIKWF